MRAYASGAGWTLYHGDGLAVERHHAGAGGREGRQPTRYELGAAGWGALLGISPQSLGELAEEGRPLREVLQERILRINR